MSLRDLFLRVKSMKAEEAKIYIQTHPEESFMLLDVRQPGEYEQEHLPGAKLIPLPRLSDTYTELDATKPTIVYCAIGGRSLVAAKMLRGRGFKEIYNLKGGIKAWNGAKATGPHEFHLGFLDEADTPEGMFELAFRMEDGLVHVYTSMRGRTSDPELADLFSDLTDFEKRHKDRIVEIARCLGLQVGVDALEETEREPDRMEGGIPISEFLSKNAPYLETVPNVLNVAMMIETQALDLFLRLAGEIDDDMTRAFLNSLAGEEKQHLTALAQLLEKRI
jgi:rhodanese-related sulfurtransferase/rubrerythrin